MSPSNNASTLQALKIPTQSSLELQNQGLDPYRHGRCASPLSGTQAVLTYPGSASLLW